mmetsp:Transcript_46759/g.99233  ORF Transcript_46759/g.99233 Transcript_46759/m.99233 type:complete len:234 (-) Transcript_46759:17-718(-)
MIASAHGLIALNTDVRHWSPATPQEVKPFKSAHSTPFETDLPLFRYPGGPPSFPFSNSSRKWFHISSVQTGRPSPVILMRSAANAPTWPTLSRFSSTCGIPSDMRDLSNLSFVYPAFICDMVASGMHLAEYPLFSGTVIPPCDRALRMSSSHRTTPHAAHAPSSRMSVGRDVLAYCGRPERLERKEPVRQPVRKANQVGRGALPSCFRSPMFFACRVWCDGRDGRTRVGRLAR